MTVTYFSSAASASALQKALLDIREGMFGTFIWFYLAWQDTKQRYRRSMIGQFWITISTGIFVLAMGPLYGALFNQEIGPYIQYVAVSFIFWAFISGFINESCTAFTGAAGYINEIKLPLTVHLLRVLAKNLIMLAHNAIVLVIVLICVPPSHFGSLLLVPIGLFAVIGNLLWLGMVLAILCARFRDVPQIVASIIQVAFFVSPILWRPEMLSANKLFLASFNPLFHLVEVVRTPMLGNAPATLSWIVVFGMLALGSIIALGLFSRFRARIVYWV